MQLSEIVKFINMLSIAFQTFELFRSLSEGIPEITDTNLDTSEVIKTLEQGFYR